MPAAASRVLFLGLDGGTMRVLGPAFERGWMPNLAAFWNRAAWGSLRSTDPMITPVAWTSFLTGCHPPTHGIHEFYRHDPVQRTIWPNQARRIQVPTLWEVLSDLGGTIVSLNVPMTYPAPPVRGLVVAGCDAPSRSWAFAHCPDFDLELREHVPDYSHKFVWKERPRRLPDLKRLAARNRGTFRALADAAWRADARVDWTALMVHFHDLDALQHRLWPYLSVDDTALDAPAWTAEVVSCLRALDDAIGSLLELASLREAAVIALSDHGFGPCRALVDVNGLLRRAGLQKGLPYGTRFRYRFSRALHRLRRWRSRREGSGDAHRSGRPIDGQVACDWNRSLAYAPFGQLSGCVFLNRHLLTSERQRDEIRQQVIAACRATCDPANGQPVFADVFDVADRYDLDPVAAGLPDVLALAADGYQPQTKWSAWSRRWIAPDPNLPATHYREGVIALFAPDIRPGCHIDAELPDVAPTALATLGLPTPDFMEGRVLAEAFEHAPLAADHDDSPARGLLEPRWPRPASPLFP